MPRPKPIIVPGGAKFPFGGTQTSGQVSLDVDLSPLIEAFKRKKIIEESGLTAEETQGLTIDQVRQKIAQRGQQQQTAQDIGVLTGARGERAGPTRPGLPTLPQRDILSAISGLASRGQITPQQVGRGIESLKGIEPGQRPFEALRLTPPGDRQIIEDATGRKRFVDTKGLVFPSLTVPSTAQLSIDDVNKFTPESIREFEDARKEGNASISMLVPKLDFLNEKVLGMTPAQSEDVLRKEFTKLSGDFIKVRDSFQRVEASAESPSPAGDLSLIFNFMKILDPGSVVRESEFANAQTAQEFMERKGLSFEAVRRVWEGKKLSDPARKDFVDRAELLFSRQQSQHSQREDTFSNIAKRRKLNIKNVVIPLESSGLEELSDDELEGGL
jgi:hypothetical protein